MGLRERLRAGLTRSREALSEVFYMGGEVDEGFWEDLEDRLVMGDMGAEVAMGVTDDLREQAARENLTTAPRLRRALAERLAREFCVPERDTRDFVEGGRCQDALDGTQAGGVDARGRLIRHRQPIAHRGAVRERHEHGRANRSGHVERGWYQIVEGAVERPCGDVDDDGGIGHVRPRYAPRARTAALSSSVRSVRSQVKSGSSRPKWP